MFGLFDFLILDEMSKIKRKQKELEETCSKKEPQEEKYKTEEEFYNHVISVVKDLGKATAQEIYEEMKYDGLTIAKVRARLSKAVKEGIVHKEKINDKIYYF